MAEDSAEPGRRGPNGPPTGALSRLECMELLAGEEIGRLVVVVDHYPQVFPVNYRLDESVVVFRVRPGTRLGEAHHQNVTFEVDYLDPVTCTGWCVVVQGMAEDMAARRPDQVTERTQVLGDESWGGSDQPWLVRIIPAHVTGTNIGPGDIGWGEE